MDNGVAALFVYIIVGVYKLYVLRWWGRLVVIAGAIMIFLMTVVYAFRVMSKMDNPPVIFQMLCPKVKESPELPPVAPRRKPTKPGTSPFKSVGGKKLTEGAVVVPQPSPGIAAVPGEELKEELEEDHMVLVA